MSTKSLSLRPEPISRPVVQPLQSTAAWRVPTLAWVMGILGFVTVAGVAAGIGRLVLGLQASTQLNDTYSWGIWIGFDFGLIAFAGAGFTMAAVVHIFHLERFHAALRPALLVGLLGYMGVLALLVLDLGRWDRFYHFLLYFNLHSPLFEISWCVLLYSTVLLLEVSPDVLSRLGPRMRWMLRVVEFVMIPVTIIGVTLSTLHQSTLGTLYLNMPYRLHPLWYTPVLPILFYVSSIMAGLSLAIIAYKSAMIVRKQPEDPQVATGLGVGVMWVALLYSALKVGELIWSGDWSMLLQGGVAWLWLGELVAGAVLPAILFSVRRWREQQVVQWVAPLLVLGGVLLNRFDATLFAQMIPPDVAAYTPHILEWLSTFGVLAGAALAWLLAVRFLMRDEH